ncbi:multifunctional methyltransferase subunit TRM112-like protein isoform X1 [Bubalus kerabau]|uniref:multifunctional methyltransferase subunit TRM112-like protein isoform X1 n=1 Tax=Bubalus carabanensis TaxID=3119969 RepID=UPI001D12FABA|nr:multifunctional methyltransferase subunit TRM112-like protein isoform X1 [Bubalus carabanensis]
MLPGAARDTNRPRLQRAPEVQKVRRFRSSQVSNRIERDSPGNDATEVRINPVEFNPDFIVRMIPKVEWAALLEAADHLHLIQVPKEPIQGYEHNEEFLRKMHHVLLEVEVLEGTLQCPESGRVFPISRGIPNMLLSDEETET